MKQPGFYWTDFNEVWYLNVFLKYILKVQFF